MGFPVRAIVRGDDERAQSLRALGAEVFVADPICALSGAPSNDRALSAGRRGDHLGLGVRLRRPAMPKAWRRSGHPADGDRTLLAATALHLRLPSAEAPLATAHPLASVELLAAFHAAFGGREEELHFVDFELAQKGSSRRRRTVIRPRTARTSVADFGVRFTSPPPTRRRSTGVPSARLYNGPRG